MKFDTAIIKLLESSYGNWKNPKTQKSLKDIYPGIEDEKEFNPITDTIISMVKKATEYENKGDLEARNLIARKLFSSPSNRRIQFPSGTTVETWWDSQSRNFITEVENPYVPSDTTGHKHDAAISHLWALNRAINQNEI